MEILVDILLPVFLGLITGLLTAVAVNWMYKFKGKKNAQLMRTIGVCWVVVIAHAAIYFLENTGGDVISEAVIYGVVGVLSMLTFMFTYDRSGQANWRK